MSGNFKKKWDKKCKESHNSIAEAAIKARELGMTYGQYQSYLYLAAEEAKKKEKLQHCSSMYM